MQAEKFDDLVENAGESLASRFGLLREKAEHMIAEQVEVMKEQGKAYELSDDEIRLLKAYRRFVARAAAGQVFSWYVPHEVGIVLPPDVSIIVDPREVVRT